MFINHNIFQFFYNHINEGGVISYGPLRDGYKQWALVDGIVISDGPLYTCNQKIDFVL
jgi:hypothetical protein